MRGFPHFLDTKKLTTLRLDLMQSGKNEVDTFLPKLERLHALTSLSLWLPANAFSPIIVRYLPNYAKK